MPKNLFFSINEEKRNMLLDIAINEFTSKPFEEVSVNNIIKKAKISRGSFYTYFENLEDLFHYLLKEIMSERLNHAKVLIQESNGDFFVFTKKMFLYDFDAYSKRGTYSLFKNYIHFIQITKKGSLKETLVTEMYNKINQMNMNWTKKHVIEKLGLTPDEFTDLIEVSIILTVNTFIKSENEHLSKEEAISLFNKRMTQLEYGVRKR